ncbi:MAG: hypothetical protein II103_01805 [Treponema sp.]|nr:hypothetical protein [Treponema sp.]
MQEEAGSVEEPLEQTSDKTEPTPTEEQQKPAQKKSSKKKKDSVPTVDEVVAKETEAEEPVKKSAPAQSADEGSRTSRNPRSSRTDAPAAAHRSPLS